MDTTIDGLEPSPAQPAQPSEAVAAVLAGAVEQARAAIIEFSGENNFKCIIIKTPLN